MNIFPCALHVYMLSCFNVLPCVHAQLLQSYPTLCNPLVWSLTGSSVHRILQGRILEWVAMPSSRGSFQSRDQTFISWSPALQVDFCNTIRNPWEACAIQQVLAVYLFFFFNFYPFSWSEWQHFEVFRIGLIIFIFQGCFDLLYLLVELDQEPKSLVQGSSQGSKFHWHLLT